MSDLKIGVFDSGVGGLTVLKGLQEALPNETFIYVGDNLHSPYGEKTVEQLLCYTKEIVEFFIQEGVKLIVLACNTTSCTVLDDLRKLYDVPMLGVIDATCKQVLKSDYQQVLIMATKATINSQAYQKRLGNAIGLACPQLVPYIENGATKEEIDTYLNEILDEPMKTCDSIVLGCTHYPIVSKNIQALYPLATLYSSSDAIIADVKNYLENHQLQATNKGKSVIYTTGELSKFIASATPFFDFRYFDTQRLDLEEA